LEDSPEQHVPNPVQANQPSLPDVATQPNTPSPAADLSFSDISLCLPEECKHVLLANMISNLLEAHDYNLISTLNKLFIGKEAEDIVFSLLRFYEKQGKALNFIFHLIGMSSYHTFPSQV
jgi:hypothetical protein